ncbi:MAG: hypothetical protein ACPGQL_01950 [Thermoplasmatota archaeon]
MKWLLLLMLVPLAGCLDDSGSAETDEAATGEEILGPDDVERTWRSLEFQEELTLNRVSLHQGPVTFGTGIPPFGSNCLWLTDDQVEHVQEMMVTMTWSALTPAWENLELIIDGDEETHRVIGGSPLVLEVGEVTPHSFFEGIGIIVQTDLSGPVVEQGVMLEVVGTYAGATDVDHEYGNCTWGRGL